MITSKDMINTDSNQTLDKQMTRNPLTVHLRTSIASAAHLMVWEGIELLPVVDTNRKMIGVISRKDVMKVMQYIQRQPQIGETFEDLIWSGFDEVRDEQGQLVFRGVISPQMSNNFGSGSAGILTTLMTLAAYRVVHEHKKGDLVIDNMSTYFIKPVQMDSVIDIRPKIIEISRKFGKIDVEIYHDGQLISKALLTAQVFDQ
jgi:predicted transcriptional regulator